jgi:hypothetical protein
MFTIKVLALAMGLLSQLIHAAEEPLDLSKIDTPAAQPPAAHNGLKILGRVDLTAEFAEKNDDATPHDDTRFKNYHFFLFLKAAPSPKVEFLGEFVSQSFYEIAYAPKEFLKLHLGKILVPFGDNSRFHHFYGGIHGYGGQGVMLPNIWAESGINAEWTFGQSTMDVYAVNGFTQPSAAVDVDLRQRSNGSRIAGGLRGTCRGFNHLTMIGSAYYEQWAPGKPLMLYGADALFDYGFLPWSFLKKIRVSLGRAQADIRDGLTGSLTKIGDYLEFGTNALPSWEFRARYGTYIHDHRTTTVDDVHNFNLGLLTSVDVLRLLLEYQWNFEAVDEFDNDILRAMVSMDF